MMVIGVHDLGEKKITRHRGLD